MVTLRHFAYPALTLSLLGGVCLHGAFADTAPATFSVGGDVAEPKTWDPAKIGRELSAQVQVVKYSLKGSDHTAHAVPLFALIEASHPKINAKIKHHDLQFVVFAQGFDGYTVAFSMAEISPVVGSGKAWVALDQDGKPIHEEGGALEIIVPTDAKPGRWVHGISAITVVDGAKLPPAAAP